MTWWKEPGNSGADLIEKKEGMEGRRRTSPSKNTSAMNRSELNLNVTKNVTQLKRVTKNVTKNVTQLSCD